MLTTNRLKKCNICPNSQVERLLTTFVNLFTCVHEIGRADLFKRRPLEYHTFKYPADRWRRNQHFLRLKSNHEQLPIDNYYTVVAEDPKLGSFALPLMHLYPLFLPHLAAQQSH